MMVHGVVAVSMSTLGTTCSSGRPSWSATIWRATVAWPCPWGTVPSKTDTTPWGSTLTRTCSVEPDLSRPATRSSCGVARAM